MEIILLIIYLWLGCKSINFIKTNILGLDYAYITSTSNFIFSKIFWALILGWISIPIWIISSALGVGRK